MIHTILILISFDWIRKVQSLAEAEEMMDDEDFENNQLQIL